MNEIMNKLFEQYNFVKTWEEDNRMFYVNRGCKKTPLTEKSPRP